MIPVQTFICADHQCKAFIRVEKPLIKLLRLGICPMRCGTCGRLQPPYIPQPESAVIAPEPVKQKMRFPFFRVRQTNM